MTRLIEPAIISNEDDRKAGRIGSLEFHTSLMDGGDVRRAVADNAAVPRLATFYGIVIWMYRPDHPPPHFHAQYGDHVAQIELATLRVLNGSLSTRALRLVRAWARLHTEELAENWTRAQELEPLAPIEPLP